VLAARSPVIDVRLNYAIAAARIRGLSGRVAEATRSLEASLAEASKHGYVGYQYEVRLTLGELEMKSGNAISGRTRLDALEKDARARGFLLIARKASAASGTHS
jgi:predicted SPOUT superfamily RNA methylase MTH1